MPGDMYPQIQFMVNQLEIFILKNSSAEQLRKIPLAQMLERVSHYPQAQDMLREMLLDLLRQKGNLLRNFVLDNAVRAWRLELDDLGGRRTWFIGGMIFGERS